MTITDLLPWNRKKDELEIQERAEENTLLSLQDEMDSLFEDFFNRPFGLLRQPAERFGKMGSFSPSIDLSEDAKKINIKAELPGMEAEDIGLELHNDKIIIKGEKKSEKEEKGEQFHRLERSYGSFQRDIPLPAEVDADQTKANFKNGVLFVELPKVKPDKPRRKIKIKSGS